MKRENDNLAVTAKDRVHSYLGGGADLAVGGGFLIKPSIMLRKVKGLPITTDFTGMLSWQNQFDVGISQIKWCLFITLCSLIKRL